MLLMDRWQPDAVQFPTGAPALNSQEVLWKQTRRWVSHIHLHSKPPELADKLERRLNTSSSIKSILDRHEYSGGCPFLN